jgi:hypothetical protein
MWWDSRILSIRAGGRQCGKVEEEEGLHQSQLSRE